MPETAAANEPDVRPRELHPAEKIRCIRRGDERKVELPFASGGGLAPAEAGEVRHRGVGDFFEGEEGKTGAPPERLEDRAQLPHRSCSRQDFNSSLSKNPRAVLESPRAPRVEDFEPPFQLAPGLARERNHGHATALQIGERLARLSREGAVVLEQRPVEIREHDRPRQLFQLLPARASRRRSLALFVPRPSEKRRGAAARAPNGVPEVRRSVTAPSPPSQAWRAPARTPAWPPRASASTPPRRSRAGPR